MALVITEARSGTSGIRCGCGRFKGVDGKLSRYAVRPIATTDGVIWIDPGGFQVAKSISIPGASDANPSQRDYELFNDASGVRVVAHINRCDLGRLVLITNLNSLGDKSTIMPPLRSPEMVTLVCVGRIALQSSGPARKAAQAARLHVERPLPKFLTDCKGSGAVLDHW